VDVDTSIIQSGDARIGAGEPCTSIEAATHSSSRPASAPAPPIQRYAIFEGLVTEGQKTLERVASGGLVLWVDVRGLVQGCRNAGIRNPTGLRRLVDEVRSAITTLHQSENTKVQGTRLLAALHEASPLYNDSSKNQPAEATG
jgi:hypothetical protein